MPFVHNDSLKFPTLKQVNLPTGRVYQTQDGSVYPSITRVLAKKPKPQLEAWKKRVGPKEAAEVSARATVQGSHIHKLCECFLSNQELPRYMPNVAELWVRLRPWIQQHVTCVYAQEQSIYSSKLGVAGRLDLLIDVDNVLAIGDFKSSKQTKKDEWVEDYYLQGTFYAAAVYEHTGRAPRRIVLPIVSPEGLQVFECSPRKYWDELMSRIEDFYQSYASETVVDSPASA